MGGADRIVVLTLMVGLIQLAVALLRLGTLTHFIAPAMMTPPARPAATSAAPVPHRRAERPSAVWVSPRC